jgi:hypothetical protein
MLLVMRSNNILAAAAVDQALGNAEGWGGFQWKTPERGVATHIYAAFEPSLKGTYNVSCSDAILFKEQDIDSAVENNGAYLQDSRIANPYTDTVKPWVTDKVEADRLWKLSEKLIGQEFSY